MLLCDNKLLIQSQRIPLASPRRELEPDTPALVVDADRLTRNLVRWQRYCEVHGLANRPHAKTHKCVEIARQQVGLGAVGLTCQTLSEAEAMIPASPAEILVPHNIVGDRRLERLAVLHRQVPLVVTADTPAILPGLDRAAAAAGRPLDVLVDLDAGFGRSGVGTAQAAADLARSIAAWRSLRFAGVLSHPVLPATRQLVEQSVTAVRRTGLSVRIVSCGGTRTMWDAATVAPSVTEYRVGAYAFYDRAGIAAQVAGVEDVALTVAATVISRSGSRVTLDAGSKTLSSDNPRDDGWGLILEDSSAVITRLDEEHAIVQTSTDALRIGDRVHIVPNHVCGTVALADWLWVTRRGRLFDRWRVDARGCST